MGWYKELKETYQVYKERDPAIRTYWDVPVRPSGRDSSLTTAPVSSSARPVKSVTMSPCTRA